MNLYENSNGTNIMQPGQPDDGQVVTPEGDTTPVSAAPLENPGSTEVTSGDGASIGVNNVLEHPEQAPAERANFTPVQSSVPSSSQTEYWQ
jgi:hypothetical protein